MNIQRSEFFSLKGKVIVNVLISTFIESIDFFTSSGEVFRLKHDQDCCENVEFVNLTFVNFPSIFKSEIIEAEEDSGCDDPPWYSSKYIQDRHTWTNYRIKVANGNEIRFWVLGQSNGCYNETMLFTQILNSDSEEIIENKI